MKLAVTVLREREAEIIDLRGVVNAYPDARYVQVGDERVLASEKLAEERGGNCVRTFVHGDGIVYCHAFLDFGSVQLFEARRAVMLSYGHLVPHRTGTHNMTPTHEIREKLRLLLIELAHTEPMI